MALVRYFFKRFFLHVFFINFALTLTFNFIEFFEKMVHVKHATTETILYFILLNLIPSFLENLPVGTWIASCVMLKELHQQNELETLQLLNISFNKIFNLFLVSGMILAIFNFIGKEFITHNIYKKTEIFKQEKFKQSSNKKLFNQWFKLNNKTFCHFDYLDLNQNQGEGFILAYLTSNFALKKAITSQNFYIDKQTKEIIIPKGTMIITNNQEQHYLQNKRIFHPAFFIQLHINANNLTFIQMFYLLLFDNKTLPSNVYSQFFYIFLNRILSIFLLIFYPILTFALFSLISQPYYYKWILIILPYPFATLLFTVTDFLMQTFQIAYIAIIPYAILLLTTTILYLSIRK